jgi:hypothetical protein
MLALADAGWGVSIQVSSFFMFGQVFDCYLRNYSYDVWVGLNICVSDYWYYNWQWLGGF